MKNFDFYLDEYGQLKMVEKSDRPSPWDLKIVKVKPIRLKPVQKRKKTKSS
jgi:hypothetical protein